MPNNHQTVTIDRSSLSEEFLHNYFVFIINDRLKIVQPTDSPTGWLYLVLLHAMTSHPLSDEYIQMTGMERAFQLLNSAGCWSDQPFDALCLNIIGQIGAISPKVNYYPEHLTEMEKIDWNCNGIPYSMQHFGYYLLAKKLIETSEQLSFMYSSSIILEKPEIFYKKFHNEILLKKLYWDYRDSYNPLARLSTEMESDILRYSNSQPYQTTSKSCSRTSNYSPIHLINDLYQNGNLNLIDYSKKKWLPLSQWVNDRNKFNTIWIGLLQMVVSIKALKVHQRQDEIEQFDKLIDFLHYISDKLKIKPFCLQMLKTVLHVSTVSLIDVSFPPFISYQKIEEISIIRERIHFQNDYPWGKTNQILAELNNCWCNNHEYDNRNHLVTPNEKSQINQLLKSWKNNFKLRTFLESIENRICSVSIEHLNKNVLCYPQQFIIENIKNHYRLIIKQTDKIINQKLLSNADRKFNYIYSDYFNKPSRTLQTVNRQNDFINEIFPPMDNEENSLQEITDHFRNQLNQSWKKLLSHKQIQKENPSIKEIDEYLNYLRKQTTCYWNELIRSITEYNEHLFHIGLIMRITPTTLISYFLEKVHRLHLSIDQQTLLGGILVNWTLEQQLERSMHFAIHNKWDDFNNEISNIPHSNWIPSEHILWLILELEMNITIRQIQINVARHMIEPNMKKTDDNKRKNVVMQMNMGEGKTSVILPMLSVSMCSSSSSLIRIVVLKSLFPMNYQSLRSKLGGLLNQRIYPFTCRRDMKFNETQIEQIGNRLKQGLCNYDVILTTAEDILSFDLLSIDKCQENESEIGRSMLIIQQWMKEYIRDILDESDEILHVKYQLIYTMGGQQQIDGGAERWETIQSILDLVKKHIPTIANQYRNEVCYKSSEQKSAFPQLRLLSSQPFPLLCEKIAQSWIKNRNYLHPDKKLVLSFILKIHSSIKHLAERFPISHIQLFLIVRGLLSSEVLLFALKKRYRVNYGINLNPSFNRLMSVPFRAKDVPADRTEFGHLDLALILTQLSYYYSGLNDKQLFQCLTRLSEKENDPSSIYDQWILYEKRDDIPYCIKQWERVNLKDYQQRTSFIFPTFQYNMLVINYFLNHFVFPQEAKQFPHKLVASAWDLSSSARSKIITGFSGTNDTQLLLPIDIRQYDLSELEKTDAIVINNLLKTNNESYQSLPFDVNSNEILNKITNYKEMINVILDVGALFIDQTNRNIAVNWLNLSDQNQIDYAVYFHSDSIFVCDRQFHHHRFDVSPASERLDHCVFYFDEIHTRGTDLKFPNGFKAAVTLGNNLTKDRLVQACMRMRKLGYGHSLTFWSSYEVHQQIRKFKQNPDDSIRLVDILRWVYANTIESIWDGLHYWSAQSLNFQRKLAAFRQIDWKNGQPSFQKNTIREFARKCLEPEITELIRTYGTPKTLQLIDEIYFTQYKQFNKNFSEEIHNAVTKRLRDYRGKRKRLSQMLGEEHQRELEYELEEERQVVTHSSVRPCKFILHKEIINLCDTYKKAMNLSDYPSVFQPLVYAFTGTTFSNHCQPNCWQQNFWVSTEFQRVIQTKGESMDFSMRPPRWIVVYRNLHIIFISPLEANLLISRLRTSSHKHSSKNEPITTLRLLLPRMKPSQSIFVNTPTLMIPQSVEFPRSPITFTIPLNWIVQLFIFNGTLYFKTIKEQTAYCHCLGLCPKPRTKIEKDFFEKGWIAIDGFVNDPEHRSLLKIDQNQFLSNPLTFVKQLIEYRNNSSAPITSHVGSIIYNSLKLIQPNI